MQELSSVDQIVQLECIRIFVNLLEYGSSNQNFEKITVSTCNATIRAASSFYESLWSLRSVKVLHFIDSDIVRIVHVE